MELHFDKLVCYFVILLGRRIGTRHLRTVRYFKCRGHIRGVPIRVYTNTEKSRQIEIRKYWTLSH